MNKSIKMMGMGIVALCITLTAQADEKHQRMDVDAAEASAQVAISARGVVKDVDWQNKKITITHEAIPAIGWPAMTMRFTFIKADDNINALQPGNHVKFSFFQQGNISILKDISVIPA